MKNKKTIQLAHIILMILGLIFVIMQKTTVLTIAGIIMLVPSLMFLTLLVMTLDYEFARDHYKKLFRVPD